MRKRIYFEINEETAKRAKSMMSFSDYVTGSQTAAYKASVDKAYDLTDKVAEKKPDEAESAYRLAECYSKKLAEYYNKDNEIACRCPSVMIAGPANFPVKKKEKQIQAWERNHENYKYCESLLSKIENLLYKQSIIKSGDEDAIEKLEKNLAGLQEALDMMKRVNAYYRKNKTPDSCPDLTSEQIEKLKVSMSDSFHYEDKPFMTYALTNNNATIKNTKARLEKLKAAKEKGTTETETDFCKVVENTEEMRLQLIFDGKPEPEVREILKRNGLRWSPKNTAWQRQLTNNARYSAERVLEEIKKVTA